MTEITSPTEPIRSGAIIWGGYEVIRGLDGEVGFDSYLCKDPTVKDRQVIVRLPKDEVNSNRVLKAQIKRALRATQIVDDPHTVRVLDFFEENSNLVVVSESAGGSNLNTVIQHNQALNINEAVQILLGCCVGLKAIHQTGQVHGDIQPEHIIISDKAEIRIDSFGLGALLPLRIQRIISTGQGPELLDCMPPEFLGRQVATAQCDIYALGVIGYKLITGKSPYTAQTVDSRIAEKKEQLPTPPHHHASDCPDKLSAIIMRMIATDTAIRFRSIDEVFVELKVVAGDKGAKTSLPPPSKLRRLGVLDLPLFWAEAYAPYQIAKQIGLFEPLLLQIQSAPARARVALFVVPLIVAAVAIPFAALQQPSPPTAASPVNVEEVTAPDEDSDSIPSSVLPPIIPTAASSDYSSDFSVGLPSGLTGQIYFVAELQGKKKIISFDPETRALRRVVDDGSDNFDPSVAPDHKILAFVSTRDGAPQIFTQNLPDGTPAKVTNLPRGSRNPDWSPKDGLIVFSGELEPSQKNFDPAVELFTVNPSNSTIEQLTKLGGRNLSPKWSPDGKFIAYTTDRFWPGSDICLWHLEEKSEECIRTGSVNYSKEQWIPGKGELRLIMSVGKGANSWLEIYSPTSGRSHQLPSLGTQLTEVAVDSKGSWFVAIKPADNGGQNNLFAVNEIGEERLLLSSPYSIRSPYWAAH